MIYIYICIYIHIERDGNKKDTETEPHGKLGIIFYGFL